MQHPAPRVALLGLGLLGAAVARRLAGEGFELLVWDRTPARELKLAAPGISLATTIEGAVHEADIVATILFDANAVLDVMDHRGALAAMKPGAIWVQMSTIGVAGTDAAIALAARRPDVAFVDAPVSGSQVVAESGALVVLASGDRERAELAAQPFFDAIAGRVHWLGEAGQGTRVGLLFNAWIGIMIENVAEVTTLARALGIEPGRFVDLLSDGALVPPWALAKFHKIVENRTDEIEVPLRLAHKNLLLALAAAGEARSRMPALDRIAEAWTSVVRDAGYADISALYRLR